jgi:hypothetical protein
VANGSKFSFSFAIALTRQSAHIRMTALKTRMLPLRKTLPPCGQPGCA